ncbi:MAG: hypothetical protein RL536_612 [Candidatus Parcubacteria bacterium]|jgi:hypothetical protein
MNDTTWYIDPLGDSAVNALIAQQSDYEDECRGQMCSDGVRRDLWRCTHDLISRLQKMENAVRMHYCIYRKRGSGGQIELWRFERSKRIVRQKPAQVAA